MTSRQHTRTLLTTLLCASNSTWAAATTPPNDAPVYPDGRPTATFRMPAKDQGVVLKHGDGPGQCDMLGARDIWVYESAGTYYMHYDGAGPKGWLACLATSTDLVHWDKKGPVLDFGKPGEDDSASASYGVTYFDGKTWHMFYLGTPHTSPAPDLVPSFPYLTMKAQSKSPSGPWTKQPEVVPFRTKTGTYYSATASPGHIIKRGDDYLMFFSASTESPMLRTLGIARTRDLNGPWTVDAKPIVPLAEQIENSSLYFERANNTWFLFTNHIGLEDVEYTDEVWVYWTKDLNHWDAKNKAVVLDEQNCSWSKKCLGLPSVVQMGDRLAIFYDAPGGDSKSHMKRDVGLAWLPLPLTPPDAAAPGDAAGLKSDGNAAMQATGVSPPDFQSKHLAIGLAPERPAFNWFAVDSLGQGKLTQNPVLSEPAAPAVPGLKLEDQSTYLLDGKALWRVSRDERTLTLCSDHAAGIETPPFTLTFDQKANHATLLGLMKPGERRMALPCVLHLPDMGSVRITCNVPGAKLDYDARRRTKPAFVSIAFPPATASQPHIEYHLEVVAIYPQLPGIENDPLYDGFRRDFLNLFQVNPRFQGLANNASSDPVAFSIFTYSELAPHVPPLADGLTCLDLVRMTLDRYLAGAKGYGQVGYGPANDMDIAGWSTPWTSLDTLPSFLIAACNYVEGAKDTKWAQANYAKLAAWAGEMMAADKDGNGLIEYPGTGNFGDRPLSNKRPSNWWDTINFGHEDAYANALAYHACQKFADLARNLKHGDDAKLFSEKAAKLRAAYAPTFLNPDTGVIAGWKSADGQLHDYWFTFVQGVAVSYGLLDDQTANSVMDRLLEKMREVGYTRFDLGLPGNLVPVKKGDYVFHETAPEVHGVPRLDDGSDGFQYYENGGATGCWTYYTIKALYQLGRVADARRIFHPMLAGYAAGNFQGFGPSGKSHDWRDWKGGDHGYEGLLVENYHALLAVLDDVKTPRPPLPAKQAVVAPGLSKKDGIAPAESRLNVVLITLDDLNYDSCGFTGCPIPGITPNLDRLAKEGMRFDHAYVVTSMCGPSRAVMLTGRYPHCNGIMGHGQQPPNGWQAPAVPTPNLMRLLRDQGYLTAGILKWKQSVKADEFDLTWNEGPFGTNHDDRDPEAFYQRTKESIARARREAKPFFIYVNPIDPHEPWPGTAQEAAMLKQWNPTNPPPAPTRWFTPKEVFVPPFLPDLPAIRSHIAPYYTSVHRGDQCVGRILDALRDAGQLEHTLLVFCSDHGMAVPGAKLSMFDPSDRTPMIVCWPGQVKPGTRDAEHVVSTVDFVPTILEAAGMPIPEGMNGRSLMPLLKGRDPGDWPATAYLEQNYFDNSNPDQFYPIRCTVSRDYIYIWNAYVALSKEPRPYFDSQHEVMVMMRDSKDARAIQRSRDLTYRPVEQLFRIHTDPGCWENLAAQPASEPVLRQMRAALLEKLSATADPHLQLFRTSIPVAEANPKSRDGQ